MVVRASRQGAEEDDLRIADLAGLLDRQAGDRRDLGVGRFFQDDHGARRQPAAGDGRGKRLLAEARAVGRVGEDQRERRDACRSAPSRVASRRKTRVRPVRPSASTLRRMRPRASTPSSTKRAKSRRATAPRGRARRCRRRGRGRARRRPDRHRHGRGCRRASGAGGRTSAGWRRQRGVGERPAAELTADDPHGAPSRVACAALRGRRLRRRRVGGGCGPAPRNRRRRPRASFAPSWSRSTLPRISRTSPGARSPIWNGP